MGQAQQTIHSPKDEFLFDCADRTTTELRKLPNSNIVERLRNLNSLKIFHFNYCSFVVTGADQQKRKVESS